MDDKVCNANFFSVTCLTKNMRMGRLAVVSGLTRRGGGAGEATLRIIEHVSLYRRRGVCCLPDIRAAWRTWVVAGSLGLWLGDSGLARVLTLWPRRA